MAWNHVAKKLQAKPQNSTLAEKYHPPTLADQEHQGSMDWQADDSETVEDEHIF